MKTKEREAQMRENKKTALAFFDMSHNKNWNAVLQKENKQYYRDKF